jgi:protocatechuate 3,4-dioxygenase beta subunit
MRSELATSGMRGTRFELEGAVHSTRCAPLPGARIEIWQADANGRYDERGFTLRGTLRADANGRFRVRTIVPGHYLNGYQYRPAHLHVKVSAPGHRPLTTQLYFQGDPYNTTDPWIRPSLVLNPERDGRSLRAQRTLYLSPA